MYNKNLDFFLEHQIAVSLTNKGKHATFFSRLNGERFKVIDNGREIADQKVLETCKEIHKELEYYN